MTDVVKTIDSDHSVLRALVVHHLWTLRASWRHHGIGVLQSYMEEGVEPEVRVHIWHPDLVRHGIVDCGDAHDHRFDLTSTVLYGTIEETIYDVRDAGEEHPQWASWSVENARSAGPSRGYDGSCVPDGHTYVGSTRHRTHARGDTYTLPRHVFHATRVSDLAITVCVMREKRGQARLLVPHGRALVHAFGSPASDETIRRVLDEAWRSL